MPCPVGAAGSKNMTGTTYADRVSTEENMIEYLEKHRRELEARGLNVAYWIARLRAAVDAVKASNIRQEALKAELKASTVTVNAADREAYVFASGAIDASMAAWGKDTANAEVLGRFRSKLHRPEGDAEVPSVAVPSA
jgi:hypothetical protein